MKKIIFLIIFLSTLKLNAQIELSIEQCREMALQNSYDLQIASLQHDKTVMDQKVVQTSFLPKVVASGTYAYVFEDIDMSMDFSLTDFGLPVSVPIPMEMSMRGMYMAGINLQQPVFVGGKIITGNRMAKKGVEMTEENKRLTKMNVILDAENAYWIYVSVREKVKLLESYGTMLDSLYRRVNDLTELQMATLSDVQKIRAKQSNIKYELQRARNGLELSRMSLCHIIGIDMNTPVIATDTTIKLSQKGSYNSPDILQRPEYLILQKQVELNELSVKNTRADFLPTIGFSAGYSYVAGMEFGGSELKMNLPMIMANISIPIFHFGEGSKKIKSAKFTYDISKLELEKNSELMNIEIKKVLSEYQSSFLLIESAQEAITEAEAAVKIASDNYELKMGTIFDILEAQAQFQEARSNLIEARTNCKIKEVEYLKVIGQLE
ncbi:MAG: TolC family protein [Bacteroidales bacterium]|jgi:outer membrane protein TolC|nr:TolC family protein [Bacteroidales bacterium]